jgi:type I restriction enzyme R subunit
MSLHKEINFETEICDYLGANGWLYTEGDAAGYDRAWALFPVDVLAWVQTTQPKAWETLVKNHGGQAGETLLNRLRDQIDQHGTLGVLRHGVELLGLRHPVKLAEFKPALVLNPEILARYAANRLRVVRQVHYSLQNENSIDLVTDPRTSAAYNFLPLLCLFVANPVSPSSSFVSFVICHPPFSGIFFSWLDFSP